jgi:hypothetical protein
MSSSSQRGYKSAERVADYSSSDDEAPQPPTLIERSVSPVSSIVSLSSAAPTSSAPSPSSISATRTPSPDPSSYRYIPPNTHQLSTSKEESVFPRLRTNDQLFLLRIPKGVSLKDVNFNIGKRKVRIGEEEWKLLDENIGDVKFIQPVEDSEKFEFGMDFFEENANLGNVSFSIGLNVVRDIRIPSVNGIVRDEGITEQQVKKRKHDDGEEDPEKRRKNEEKTHKHKEKLKEKHHDKEKHRNKEEKEKRTHKGEKDKKHKHKN